jgi:CRISPR-associated endonuclease/helicase Cas3
MYKYWGKYDHYDNSDCHLLVYHCLDVAAIGREIIINDQQLFKKLVTDIPLKNDYVLSLITFLLAIHDIGKFSELFQYMNADLQMHLRGKSCIPKMAYTAKTHHTILGMRLFHRKLWQEIIENNMFKHVPWEDPDDLSIVISSWVGATVGHHGRPVIGNGDISTIFDHESQRAASTFMQICADLFMKDLPDAALTCSDELETAIVHTSWLLAGLTIISDWIGSNTNVVPYCQDVIPLDEYWHTYAIPRAKEAIARIGVTPPNIVPFSGVETFIPCGATPTPLQEYVATCGLVPGEPHLFIIEDVTGSGKTDAALTLSHRLMANGSAEGLFFGLPTMATANGMYRRFEQIYRCFYQNDAHPSLILAHGKREFFSSLSEDGEIECAEWFKDNKKKTLLADIGVGTIDQALMGVLPIYHQSLRLFGLARHVLVIDEVHAYDAYMNDLIERLLMFQAMLGGSAILLSATLPQHLRKRFVDAYQNGLNVERSTVTATGFPLVTTVSTRGVTETVVPISSLTRKTVHVKLTDNDTDADAYLERIIRDGKCACWIRNTVKDAVDTYERLVKRFGCDHVKLFHAQFTIEDRHRIENDIVTWFGKQSGESDRRGKILIATQVVEQSLDLDFDGMITDLAPIDLIIQRMGRLYRHRDRRNDCDTTIPTLLVISPEPVDEPTQNWFTMRFPRAGRIYDKHGQLWFTARLLAEQRQITIPGDSRILIDRVFGEDAQTHIPEALIRREMEADGRDRAHISMARLAALDPQSGYQNQYRKWSNDEWLPTRLGEPMVTVTLAHQVGDEVYPLSKSDDNPWEKSRVTVRSTQILGDDKGRATVIMERSGNGTWIGYTQNLRGDDMMVVYDTTIGLRIVRVSV